MQEKSLTALTSAFARAYHYENNKIRVFDDSLALKLIGEMQYNHMSQAMANGISFFNPEFKGEKDDALRWIVDNQLSPSPLGRAAFAEKALETAVMTGTMQYIILGAGYDTFAYRQPEWAEKIRIFELDAEQTAVDKKKRLAENGIAIPDNVNFVSVDFSCGDWHKSLTGNANFMKCKSFFSILGVTYYLEKSVFENLLNTLSKISADGSTVVFDYPAEKSETDKSKRQSSLAAGANESFKARYTYAELEKLLEKYGFLIYEHLEPEDITQQYFKDYNNANPSHKMTAFDNVNYCLCVKKE